MPYSGWSDGPQRPPGTFKFIDFREKLQEIGGDLDGFYCEHTQFYAGLYRICLPEKTPDYTGLRGNLP